MKNLGPCQDFDDVTAPQRHRCAKVGLRRSTKPRLSPRESCMACCFSAALNACALSENSYALPMMRLRSRGSPKPTLVQAQRKLICPHRRPSPSDFAARCHQGPVRGSCDAAVASPANGRLGPSAFQKVRTPTALDDTMQLHYLLCCPNANSLRRLP